MTFVNNQKDVQRPNFTKIEEKIFYKESITDHEIKDIRSRITILENNIIFIFQIPFPSSITYQIFKEEIIKYSKNFNEINLLIDLTERKSSMYSSKDRQNMIQILNSINNIKHIAIIRDINKFGNVVFRFIFSLNRKYDFSLHKTFSEAYNAIKMK